MSADTFGDRPGRGVVCGPIQNAGMMLPRQFDPVSATDRFRINAPDATITVIFSQLLKTVRRAAPGMEFLFFNKSEGRLDALAAGEIDLAIDMYDDIPQGFHQPVPD